MNRSKQTMKHIPKHMMWGLILIAGGLVAGLTVFAPPAQAQSSSDLGWQEDAWTPIIEYEGVRFSYIFYGEADNANNGVVIRLHNVNDYPVQYRFVVVFRNPDTERTAEARGSLAAGQMKTGDHDGLFWIPFKDGQSIGEVGLRGMRITRAGSGANR